MALTRESVATMLARAMTSMDPDKALNALAQIAAAGEAQAVSEGYADMVARCLSGPGLSGLMEYRQSSNPVIMAATIKTLGCLGAAGLDYIGEIASFLGSRDSGVQIASLEALGKFGYEAKDYASRVSAMIEGCQPDVKVAALMMLGDVRAEQEAECVKQCLSSSNDAVVCAACEALGKMGRMKDHVDILRSMLSKAQTCLSALTALASMDVKVPIELLELVISPGLENPDAKAREMAITVIGNLADVASKEPYIKSLKAALKNTKAEVRAAAAVAIGSLGTKAVEQADNLVPLLADDKEEIGGTQFSQVLGTVAKRSNASLRLPKVAALLSLSKLKATACLAQIAACINDSNWEVRLAALEALSLFGTSAITCSEAVANALGDVAFPVRAAAATALGMMRAEDNASDLVQALNDTSHTVRFRAVLALAELGEAAWTYSHDIFKLLQDPMIQVQIVAVRCLSLMGSVGNNYASVLATLINHQDPELRAEAIDGLGRLGTFGAAFAEDVAECLYDKNSMVSEAAVRTLMQMGSPGKPFLIAAGWIAPPSEPASLTFDYKEDDRSVPAPTRTNKGYMSALARERAKLGI
mmetsp:Transcript_88159/g.139363  ORF Transcript_88159/g.139363 Transcript_88159/m.139363 type:complete len:587 (+) Transcript_88159:99-1859(+)